MGAHSPAREIARLVDDDGSIAVRVIASSIDLALVDGIGRLLLAARRRGRPLTVVQPAPALVELCDLVGLAPAFGLDVVARQQARREPEQREQPRVQEVVELGDLPA